MTLFLKKILKSDVKVIKFFSIPALRHIATRMCRLTTKQIKDASSKYTDTGVKST